MIDLNKLENEIDTLLESETKNSLTKWLINKRFKNLNKILGSGTFVSMQNEGKSIFSKENNSNFNNNINYSPNNPINRKAA